MRSYESCHVSYSFILVDAPFSGFHDKISSTAWTQVHADVQPGFASLALADGRWHLRRTGHGTGGFLLRRSKQEETGKGPGGPARGLAGKVFIMQM